MSLRQVATAPPEFSIAAVVSVSAEFAITATTA